jgi:hypothetical protein
VTIGTFVTVVPDGSDVEDAAGEVELPAVVLGSKAEAMRTAGKNNRNASRVFISVALRFVLGQSRTRVAPTIDPWTFPNEA